MEFTRRGLIGSLGSGVTIGLAGCLGDTGSQDGAPAETTAPSAADGPLLQIRGHAEVGAILVDAAGMTLYMFENDTQSEAMSVCSGSCAEAWPPLTVESDAELTASDEVSAKLATFERDDGTRQATADGWPLYYFASDEQPGDIAGQGVGNVWWVLRPDGTVVEPDIQVREHDEHGEILTDADGMTLYMFDQDTEGEPASACTGDCASAWTPFTVDGDVSKAAGVEAAVESFEREMAIQL
jgi:predicted lipoprotein with Yx(FWY)xxD motif